ncbi:MAG: PAC2 family protein [Propionicimonas sp.]|uniref:PAC2 family protein n=1 Tax=Propionicimonas sp. TaxID=1955623 RepID=UPI002B21A9A3|nr:PAC2 family protein [Propionicimonas sp.]MEA4943678.1 PAC2 family protein [Propionicimonas sp.]MEA5052764.1 PAC2 family protein [Propionicimonas sp.]MEA5117114.1 PAC2 family protein [Propionicimonas sp.]
MLDPRLLYTLDQEVADSLAGEEPVLVHLLDGYIDAGSVVHGLSRYLLEQCEHDVLAEFDHDQLHDYRSRRPQMVFDTNHWASLTDYSLVVYRLLDANDKPFLLFTGPEPDTQWNRTSAAVLQLAEDFGVTNLLTASGVPMAVPHTRPTLVTSHATDPNLATGNPMWIDRVQLPGSFSHMLEFRAGEAGLVGRGFVAHVPHYLAQTSFPQAIVAVLERITEAAGLAISNDDLDERAAANLATIASETADDADFPAVVAALEEQYDQVQATDAAHVPTADEIGAAVEKFLAEQDPPDYRR